MKLEERLKILPPDGIVEIPFSAEQCIALGAALRKVAEQAEGEDARDK